MGSASIFFEDAQKAWQCCLENARFRLEHVPCHRMQHLPCLTRWSNPIDNQIHRCHQQRVPTSQEAQGQYGWPRKEPQTLPLTIHHSTTLFDKASASLLLLFPTRLTSKIRLGAFSTAVTCFKKCQALVKRVER